MKLKIALLTCIVLCSMLLYDAATSVFAQPEPIVYEIEATLEPNGDYAYELSAVEASRTIYVFVDSPNGEIDPYVTLSDTAQETVIAEDDNTGGEIAAALRFRVR